MTRRTFFSFRYKNDSWRAGIVRNSWVCQGCESAGFFDSAEWEEVKKKNDSEIEKWIDSQLKGTSVTVVLIGADTYDKKWINYEILSSYNRGNGLLGVYVHNLKNQEGKTTAKGKNPFTKWDWSKTKTGMPKVYDWVENDGYNYIGKWIEEAAQQCIKV